MRIVTISWTTTTAHVAGTFVPAGYRVTLSTESVTVPMSPAVFELSSSFVAGTYDATIVVVDEAGVPRGSPAVVNVNIPDAQTQEALADGWGLVQYNIDRDKIALRTLEGTEYRERISQTVERVNVNGLELPAIRLCPPSIG
jgi:hypothetical protein